jgi:hypothetical protein
MLLSVALLLAAASCDLEGPSQTWKLNVARGASREEFGWSVSVDRSMGAEERRVLIGAPVDDRSGGVGSAHVFRLQGADWVHEAELRSDDRRVDDSFGDIVSLYEDTAAVAAPRPGGVYLFRLNGEGWMPEAAFHPEGGLYGTGSCVSIWGDRVLIGSKGMAYLFRRIGSEWTKEAELGPASAEGFFGTSVCLYGDVAIIGSPEAYDLFPRQGRAYLFRYDGSRWTQEAVLRAPDGGRADHFGNGVSLSRDACIIGAPNRQTSDARGCGTAYIFRHAGEHWTLEQELSFPTWASPGEVGEFGRNTSIDGDLAAVGAPDDAPSGAGSAYVYKRSGDRWMQVCRFAASDGEPWDSFGRAVSIGGGFIAAGAPNNEREGTCHGAVYVLKM